MMQFDEVYWTNRWTTGQTAWDIGHAAPAIIAYFAQLNDLNASILIPGCGNAYEAMTLYNMGYHNITLIEIVEAKATALLQQLEDTGIQVLHQDFFQHDGQYDYIIEQTFFCSLHPQDRPKYVQKMYALLKERAKLVGLLFNRTFEGNEPPFGGDAISYQKLFETHFSKAKFTPCANSILPRMGKEVFMQCQK